MISSPLVLQFLQIGLSLLAGWLLRHNFGLPGSPPPTTVHPPTTPVNPLLAGIAGRLQERLASLEAELLDRLVAPILPPTPPPPPPVTPPKT